MQVFSLAAFLLLLIVFSVKFDKKLVEVLPVTLSTEILLLYVLAFFKALSFIDVVGVALILACIIYIIKLDTYSRKALFGKVIDKLNDPSWWVFVVMMILIYIGVKDKLITWWDDLNFWGTDVKAIFYDNGFAGKYLNVAPEFGDYPPGTQLVKWMFLHLDPRGFNEGLMFTGYYFFIFSFLAPFIALFEKKGVRGVIGTILSGAVLFILPSCVEAFYLDGCCADICMAMAFGSFLVGVVKSRQRGAADTGRLESCVSGSMTVRSFASSDARFEMIAGTLYLSAMVLCKNTSFIWLIYAFLFYILYYALCNAGSKDTQNDSAAARRSGGRAAAWIRSIIGYFALPCSAYLSWAIFCLVNKRVARSTVGALKYVTTGVDMPDMGHELISAYIKAFFAWPLHRYNNGIIDLSPFAFLLIVTAFFIYLGLFKKISKKECIFFTIFAFAGGLIFYGINLICHLTIFSTEMQYLEPFAMVSSIERYSAPFSFGMIMLILYFLFGRGYDLKKCIIVALVIILCADLSSVARGFWTYRNDIEKVLEERNELIGDDILTLWNKSILLSDDGDPNLLYDIPDTTGEGQTAHYNGSRIMYVRDASEVSWISHAYISFFMSPVSVVYDYVDLENTSLDEIKARASELHAGYIYSGGSLYEN